GQPGSRGARTPRVRCRPPVPGFGLEHPAADGAHDERRGAPVARRDPGVGQRLAGGADGEAIGARATRGARESSANLRADTTAEAVGLDQREVPDRADAGGEAFPVRDDAGSVRTDGAEAGDDDPLHADGSFPAMNRESVSNEAKCSVRSSLSSIAMPKRSSMAIESSMKSSESRPMEPSTPFGSAVDSFVSAARRGSNFRRETRIVFSS